MTKSALWIKICGITTYEHANVAQQAGADALGFVFAPSKRRIEPQRAREIGERLPAAVAKVGVTLAASTDQLLQLATTAALTHIQIHGPFVQSQFDALTAVGLTVIQAVSVKSRVSLAQTLAATHAHCVLLDTFDPKQRGGTGHVFDWQLAADTARKRSILLAGGLNASNVAQAIEQVRPAGVDVSSGVENERGIKSSEKIKRFIETARAAQGGL